MFGLDRPNYFKTRLVLENFYFTLLVYEKFRSFFIQFEIEQFLLNSIKFSPLIQHNFFSEI